MSPPRVKVKEIELSDDLTLTLSVVVSKLYSSEEGLRVYLLPNELEALRVALNEHLKIDDNGLVIID